MKKRFFAVLLFVTLFLLFSSVSAFSGSGNGSSANPFQITNVTQLQEMGDNITMSYILNNNIDATNTSSWNDGAGFYPVGNLTTRFSGHFNGQYYNITNLYINRTSTDYVGLFGISASGSTTTYKSVGLINVSIIARKYVGALAGYLLQDTVNGSFSTGWVNGTSNVGGLAGYCASSSSSCNISHSYSNANVKGNESYAGGLVSYNEGKISYSYSTGNVTCVSICGGFSGMNTGSGTFIEYSYSTGWVNATGSTIGGFVGEHRTSAIIRNSYALGWVNSNSTGSSTSIGGLTGFQQGAPYINNSFARGNVTSDSSSARASGLAGSIDTAGGVPVIENSYATGSVQAISSTGGVAGGMSNAVCRNSFWDNVTTGKSSSYCSGGTSFGKNTTQMKNVSTYTSNLTGTNLSWDFWGEQYNDTGIQDHWHIDPNINDGYPILLGFGIGNVILPTVNFTNITTVTGGVAQTWIFANVTGIGNLTVALYNDSGLIQENTSTLSPLFVNFTSLSEGIYTLNASSNDSAGNVIKTRRIITLDVTNPSVVLNYPANAANISTRNVSFNVTVTDLLSGVKNVSLFINNGINQSNTSRINGTYIFTQNFTDGYYNWSILTYDNASSSNRSINISFTIDTLIPNITFANQTESNGSNLARNNIYVNVTAADTNFVNLTIRLYNTTSLVNESTSLVKSFAINLTGLRDGTYYFNSTTYDSAGNANISETRTITIDATYPLINYTNGTPEANQTLAQTYIFVNVSVTETNFANITFDLFNASSVINSTIFTVQNFNITWSGLTDQTYFYNVTVRDVVGNSNTTSTRNVTLSNPVASAASTSPSSPSSNARDFPVVSIPVVSDDLEKGYINGLKVSDQYRFSVQQASHTLTLNSFNASSARVTIRSQPLVVYLQKSIEQRIDVDLDGIADIVVRYDGSDGQKAKIFLREILPVAVEQPSSDYSPNETNTSSGMIDTESAPIERMSFRFILFLGVLCVAFIITLYIFRRRHHHHAPSRMRVQSFLHQFK